MQPPHPAGGKELMQALDGSNVRDVKELPSTTNCDVPHDMRTYVGPTHVKGMNDNNTKN